MEALTKEIFLHVLCGLPEAHMDAELGRALFDVVRCMHLHGDTEAGVSAGVTLDHVIVAKVRTRPMYGNRS